MAWGAIFRAPSCAATWTIPATQDLGIHTVTLTGAESGSVSIQFRVTPSGLATTGAESGPSLVWGLAFLLAGAALAAGARRRRMSVTSKT